MNIYFAGSIRGGRSHQPEYAFIVSALEKYGTVHSQHVQDETLSEYGETDLSARDIFRRELSAIEKSDVVVAELSTPSLGVGYLIALASSMGKRVIALYRGEDDLRLSAIVKGDPSISVHTYKSEEDVGEILASLFTS